MNYTSKNTTAPQNINRLTAIGLPIRNIFTSLISLFLLSFFTVGVQAQHINNHKQGALINKSSVASKTAATFTSSSNGLWSNSSTWGGGGIPNFGDDVIISPGTTVTVDINTATCQNITINGTLNFNAAINLDVNGSWINSGVFTAGSGSVTFKRSTGNTISGSSSSAFNDIIVDKGTDVTSVMEANGTGAISNTGTLKIINGLFKMTTGTFQFNAAPTIPFTGGLWINGATLNSGNFSTTVNGLIRITSGTANFGANSGNALEINNGGGTLYAFLDVQGGIINVSGRLFINNRGTIMMSNGTINVCTLGLNNASNAAFEVTATSHINTINGGTIVFQNPNSGAGGDLLITSGTGTKNITGGTFQMGNASTPANSTFLINSAIPLYNLTVYSNLVKASLATSDLTINNQLNLNGQLLLNNQNLILGSTAPPIAGTLGAATGMIVCNNGAFGGEVRKTLSSNSSYLFPVGTSSSEYSPATLTFTGTAGVKVANTKHPNNANINNYINRYWSINSSGITSLVYDITTTYLVTDIIGTDANIDMGKYAAALPWVKYNAANTGTNTLTATGVTNIGPAIGFTGITLAPPSVTITPSSSAICNGSSATLNTTVTGDPTITYLWTSSPAGFTSTNANVRGIPFKKKKYSETNKGGKGFPPTPSTTITVTSANTAGSPSSTPTLCINTALTAITHTTTGATGIGAATGLPAGVSASWLSNTITISGTPTASGTFNYSIPLTGGCGAVNATGTITVTPANTAGAPSSTPTLCINTALTSITIATTGATGINDGVQPPVYLQE